MFRKSIESPVSRRTILKSAGAVTAIGALGMPTLHTSAQESVSGKVTFAIWSDAVENASWDPMIARFNELQPDIEIEMMAIPAESWAGFFDAVSTRIAGGVVPDVIRVATEGMRLFASRGLVHPLDEYLERDQEELAEFFEDVHPNLVEWSNELSSTDGQTYYMPHGFNTVAMWVNTEVFADAGVELPTDDWTWDDFMAAAETITQPGQVFGFHAPAEYFTGIMPWMLTNGASTLNADWSESTIATPEAIESVQFMRDLVDKQISPRPGGEFDAVAMSAQGRLAMFGAGRWATAGVRDAELVDKMQMFHWPQKAGQGSPVGWDGHPIMSASENKDAAWEWVKFLASPDMQVLEVEQGGPTVPPRRSLAESDAFLANAPEGMFKLYEALDYATPIPSPDKGNIIEREIRDVLNQILTGEMEVEEGLNELDAFITDNL